MSMIAAQLPTHEVKYPFSWFKYTSAAGLTACRMRLCFRLHFMKLNCFKIIDSKSGNADRLLQDFCYDSLSHMNSSLPSLWKITYLKYFLFIFWHAFGVLCQRVVTSVLDIILVSISTTICVVRHKKYFEIYQKETCSYSSALRKQKKM